MSRAASNILPLRYLSPNTDPEREGTIKKYKEKKEINRIIYSSKHFYNWANSNVIQLSSVQFTEKKNCLSPMHCVDLWMNTFSTILIFDQDKCKNMLLFFLLWIVEYLWQWNAKIATVIAAINLSSHRNKFSLLLSFWDWISARQVRCSSSLIRSKLSTNA